ncbi:MAG: hydroxyethylthiazole kinase, partial [Brevibacterium sp.]|nr:hydroxyethylthiazole kinase [Brevibacterium sp.]
YLDGGTTASAKFEAVVAAHAHFAVAGEAAADGAQGPGSYSVNFFDALYALTGEQLATARVEAATIAGSANIGAQS